jgi:hypothetical protein
MKNIYVGNLDFSATEEGRRTLFAAHLGGHPNPAM